MVEKATSTRKKPKFLRQTWHKKIKLGKGVKKKLKWRAAKGRQSKIRLSRAGRARRPKIGWGSQDKKELVVIRNLKQLEDLKEKEIIIGKVGKKKRKELIKKANEMKMKILNKYPKEKQEKGEKNATS